MLIHACEGSLMCSGVSGSQELRRGFGQALRNEGSEEGVAQKYVEAEWLIPSCGVLLYSGTI